MIDRRQLKETSMFVVFHQLIEMELKNIEEYLDEISSELAFKQERLSQDYRDATDGIQAGVEFDVDAFFEGDINRYFKVFPVYTYNPLLLTLYGQFENWLKKLCDLDSQKGFSKITVSDLAGANYIEKSRRYLNLVSEIDVHSTAGEWQKITEIQKIRNCIAHNDSNIIKNKSLPVERQELYSIIASDKRIEFDSISGDFYIKDKGFLLEFIQIIKKYLADVIDQLKVRKVVAKNTTLPYDNASWGQEKTERLLLDVISVLDLFDQNSERVDEFKDSDLKHNVRKTVASMGYNLTKLMAFFSNGEWKVIDKDLIEMERELGLAKLKKYYE